MSALAFQNFGFEDQLVRVHDRDGAPWFAAQDVCACIELANVSQALRGLEADERDDIITNDVAGRTNRMLIVSESGLYALIFKSRKAAAVRFRKWVTQEVLPTIRKTGSYGAVNDHRDVLPELVSPDDMQRYSLALATVREARQTFGRQTARRIWHEAGLPAIYGPLSEGSPDAVPDTVLKWFDKCAAVDPEARTSSRLMYEDYKGFCAFREVPAISEAAFAHALTAMGFQPCRGMGSTSRKGRIGIRLVE